MNINNDSEEKVEEDKSTINTITSDLDTKCEITSSMSNSNQINFNQILPSSMLPEQEDKSSITQEEIHSAEFIRETRLAVIGNVDSGKSTLVGCLTKNVKDDGRGYARQFVFNYQHETDSGRTSSIGEEILGFKNGSFVQLGRVTEKKNSSWKEIVEHSDKLITLLDLCGHEKYLKTTMYGLTALLPDYAMILIGTNMGVQRMTKEHLGIVISLNIPFFIVFTKIDIAPKDVKETTISSFCNILKTGLQKTVYHIKTKEDSTACAQAIIGNVVVPIFQISSVTGEGIDNLKHFISQTIPRYFANSSNFLIKTPKDRVEFFIDSSFNTKVGVIYAGLLASGTISIGQKLVLGPTADGQFKPVSIKSIHFLRNDVNNLECGNSCSVKLKSLDKNLELSTDNFRKGMVAVSPDDHEPATLEFEIEALIVHHSSTIKLGYQSVIHCHVVRQTATIIEMNKEFLRAGDTGVIKFKFIKSPEYLHIGDIVLFREGRTRGKGKIIKVYPIDEKKLLTEKKAQLDRNKRNNLANHPKVHGKGQHQGNINNNSNNSNTKTQNQQQGQNQPLKK